VRRRERNVRRWLVEPGLIYGQVKKCSRRSRAGAGHPRDAARDGGRSQGLRGLGMGFSGRLHTAFIERVNLTVRHGIAALARRTWATAQMSPQLLAHLEWWRAYYHVVRPHAALRVALVEPRARGGKRLTQRYRQRTPAMAAGRTTRRWTAREVLTCPLPLASACEAFKPDGGAVSCRGEMGEGACRSTRMEPHSRIRGPVWTAH
jgi:hypothetical protein